MTEEENQRGQDQRLRNQIQNLLESKEGRNQVSIQQSRKNDRFLRLFA